MALPRRNTRDALGGDASSGDIRGLFDLAVDVAQAAGYAPAS